MTDPFTAAVERKARDFVAALQASLKVRRYAEAYPTWTTCYEANPSRKSSKRGKGSRHSATSAEESTAS